MFNDFKIHVLLTQQIIQNIQKIKVIVIGKLSSENNGVYFCF